MLEVTRENLFALRFHDLRGRMEDRVRKVANKVGTVNVKKDNDNVLVLEFGTEEGADKMMEMTGTLT